VVESQFSLFKRCELSEEALERLKRHCDQIGTVFLSTPTSARGIDTLARLGVPLLKNGSDFLTHLPLIRAMARSGIPTILSTGMSTLIDIAEAVGAFREAGGRELILLHCTTSYPTAPENTHLRKLPSLAATFGCPVGFSDHTEGITAALGATVLGACLIEKHFTLDRNLPGPDHRFSSDPAEFAALAAGVRTLERQLGQPLLTPTASEGESRALYRLSCAASRDLPAGHRLSETDIVFLRPGTGIPPAQAAFLYGRRLVRRVTAHIPLVLGDID
jgi:N-acetylneuraminate synthase/N,N'-diacetyllegionaminate synthase